MADLELKFANLSNRDSPARKANRQALREHIEEIQAEQADLPVPSTPPSGPPLRVADRDAGARRRIARRPDRVRPRCNGRAGRRPLVFRNPSRSR